MTSRSLAAISALSILVGLTALSLWWRYAPWSGGVYQEPAGILDGLCEASTMIRWREGYLVGDNETERQLFSFDASMTPGAPLPLGVKVEDIEALAALPNGLLVVASQGANKNGKPRPLREQVLLFGAEPVRPDLSACALCEERRALPPKEGGLSVEGAAWWQGSLWLGLRSPLMGDRAILLRMEGDPAVALRAAEIVAIDLEGQGVRELVPDGDALLVLAGPTGRATRSHDVYRLDAPTARPKPLAISLPPSTEGIVKLKDGRLLWVTDGDRRTRGAMPRALDLGDRRVPGRGGGLTPPARRSTTPPRRGPPGARDLAVHKGRSRGGPDPAGSNAT